MKPVSLVVLIPAYNEAVVIAKTVESIVAAGIAVEQIYVINDASKDKTSEIAHALGVNVIDNAVNMGKARGVQNALSVMNLTDVTHVCFMDADTLVDVNYYNVIKKRLEKDAEECEADHKKKPISVLCGRVKSIPHNWLTAFRAYELWLSQILHKSAQSKLKAITVAPGCASTYSVEALRGVVWSDDTTTEDLDSTVQVAISGGRIDYENDAIVYTQDPNTIKDYLGQIGRRWYPGTWQVMGKHKLLQRGFFKAFNWECRLMTLEPIAYIGVIAYMAAVYPTGIPWLFEASWFIVVPIALIAAIHEKRFDIFKYSMIFPIILFVNMFMFISKIGNIRGRNKQVLKWYSPERYVIK